MSYDATNWAIKQRGLKPATKLVLWHLCDRFHPDNGCFPSQITLAHDCEMSRSSLNEHLATLETAGLIAREQRRDSASRKQISTYYRFAFQDDFPSPESGHGLQEPVSGKQPEPCPENDESRVQNLDTNLVREPVREPVIERDAGEREEIEENHSVDDPTRFERRVKKIAAETQWTGWAKSPTEWAVRHFARLTDAERAEAEARATIYAKHCGKKVVALGIYFRDRKWADLPKEVLQAAEAEAARKAETRKFEPVFGPVWAAKRVLALLDGPISPLPAPRSQFIAGLLKQDSDLGRAERKKYRMEYGFPVVKSFDVAGIQNVGDGDEEAFHRFAREMTVAVPVGSDGWDAWRAYFEQQGWPWVPDPGRQPVVYFPVGGPDGLNDFEAALKGLGHDGD